MKSWRWLKYFKDAFVFRSALTAPSKRNKRCVEMFMFTRLLGFFLFRYIFLRMRQSHHSCSWKRNSKRWMSCSTLDEKPFLQLLPSELLQSKSSSSVRKALTGRASPYLCLFFFLCAVFPFLLSSWQTWLFVIWHVLTYFILLWRADDVTGNRASMFWFWFWKMWIVSQKLDLLNVF